MNCIRPPVLEIIDTRCRIADKNNKNSTINQCITLVFKITEKLFKTEMASYIKVRYSD